MKPQARAGEAINDPYAYVYNSLVSVNGLGPVAASANAAEFNYVTQSGGVQTYDWTADTISITYAGPDSVTSVTGDNYVFSSPDLVYLTAGVDEAQSSVTGSGFPTDSDVYLQDGQIHMVIPATQHSNDGDRLVLDFTAALRDDRSAHGSVFVDNGAGADVDTGTPLQVTAVQGDTALVGQSFTSALGATVQVNADGSYAWDAGSKLHYLAAQDSGARDTLLTDTFTYTDGDGSSATVSINVAGVEGNGDVLIGSGKGDVLTAEGAYRHTFIGLGGDDTMHGGVGNDTYLVKNPGDANDVITDLGGRDTVKSTVDFSLQDYPGLEKLVLAGHAGVSGSGNASGNLIRANDAGDTILGAGGADHLMAGAGSDTFTYISASDSGLAHSDRITGFDDAADKFYFPNLIDLQVIGSGGFDADGTPELRFDDRVHNDRTFVEVDVDGNGTADMRIVLDGHHALTQDNLLVV